MPTEKRENPDNKTPKPAADDKPLSKEDLDKATGGLNPQPLPPEPPPSERRF